MQMWSYFILTYALHLHQTDHISVWLPLMMKLITRLSVSSVEAGKSSVLIDGEGHTKGGSFLPCMEPGQFTEFSWSLLVGFLCHSETPEAQNNLENLI